MEDNRLSPPQLLRLAAVVFVVAWFLVPGLRDWIPLWVPFLAVAALELSFLVSAWRERGTARPRRRQGPQETDIEEFGGEEWLEPVLVEVEGEQVWLPTLDEDAEPRERPASRPRGPGLRFRTIVVVGLAAVALALFVLPESGWDSLDEDVQARVEERLSAEAARIAGHEARVHCDAEGEAVGIVQHADGLAEVGGTNAFLTPEICYRLHRVTEGDEGPFSQTARALAVLAHEAWHLRGEADEGVTNCYAFQSGVSLGVRLGLSERTAERMMRQQLADNATLARSSPDYLVPGECRDGGRLDLDPDSGRFP